MDALKCYIDPFADKQMVKDMFTREEFWIESDNLCEKLYNICNKRKYEKIILEGAYIEGFELMNKFKTMYPASHIIFYTI